MNELWKERVTTKLRREDAKRSSGARISLQRLSRFYLRQQY